MQLIASILAWLASLFAAPLAVDVEHARAAAAVAAARATMEPAPAPPQSPKPAPVVVPAEPPKPVRTTTEPVRVETIEPSRLTPSVR